MKVTNYTLQYQALPRTCKLALASDLHGHPFEEITALLRSELPDMILIPGEVMSDIDLRDENAVGYAFLRECASIAPTVYSLGNHELACYHKGNPWRHPTPIPLDLACIRRVRDCGVTYLDNDCISLDGFTVCGLTSGINKKENKPNPDALARFANADGFRILLCHHPEYFKPYIQSTSIELTVSGHAHGGQWRVFGRGVYAPGQGIFPKYTSGVVGNRLVISRGLANHSRVPRIFNSPELVFITLERSTM